MTRNLAIVITLAITAFTTTLHAQTIGKRHLDLSAGHRWIGNHDFADAIDDSATTYGAGVNLPATDSIDFTLSFGYITADGDLGKVTGNGVSAGLVFHHEASEKSTLYYSLSLGIIENDVTDRTESLKIESEDSTFSFSFGSQYMLSDSLSLTPNLRYTEAFQDSRIYAGVELHKWFTDRIGFAVSTRYQWDYEDVDLSGALTIGF